VLRHLRLIEGGKQARSRCPESTGTRLYRAYSIGDITRGAIVYHDVTFHWYCVERNPPLGPSETLVAGGSRLEAKQRRLLERDVSRTLTEDEVSALRSYLRERFDLEVHSIEVPLPITEPVPLFEGGASIVYDFLELAERDGYPLPVKIWGYYTIINCLSSPALESGVLFLKRALGLLGLSPAVQPGKLETIVKNLYLEDGLYVKNGRVTE
jgi:hypothetical protein